MCPECGVYLSSLLRDVLPTGTLLRSGAYRVDYALGRGGFGITYRAMHVALEQAVAIKEFYPQEYAVRASAAGTLMVSSAQNEAYQRALERFTWEGKILAGLNHPGIVRVSDLFEERGTAYLVMELISGESLSSVLNRLGRLSVGRTLDVLEQTGHEVKTAIVVALLGVSPEAARARIAAAGGVLREALKDRE